MKLMIVSDIHGSGLYLEKVLERYGEERPDLLVLLGDILYHGPRNPLPIGYDTSRVISQLNPLKNIIIAVRGNCDAEVDQMVLDFPMRGDYQQLVIDQQHFFFSHGHLFDNELPKMLPAGTIYIQGHTHVPMIKRANDCWHLNPGSVTLPKENHPNTYGVYEDGRFSIKDLLGKTYLSVSLGDMDAPSDFVVS